MKELRLQRFENAIGFSLPGDYRAFVLTHDEDFAAAVRVVSTNPDYWDVRTLFEVGGPRDHAQIDRCYDSVRDVLPVGMLPIAEDSGGNLYLIDCRPGPTVGTVHWWDHEQEVGEHRLAKVADSFDAFLASLAPDEA